MIQEWILSRIPSKALNFLLIPLAGVLIFHLVRIILGTLIFSLSGLPGFSGLALAIVFKNFLIAAQFLITALVIAWFYRVTKASFDSTVLTFVALPVAIAALEFLKISLELRFLSYIALGILLFITSFYLVDKLLCVFKTYRAGEKIRLGGKAVRYTIFALILGGYTYYVPLVSLRWENIRYYQEVAKDVLSLSYKVFSPTWVPDGMVPADRFYNQYYTSPENLILYANMQHESEGYQSLTMCETGMDNFTAGQDYKCPTDCGNPLTSDEPFLPGTCKLIGKTNEGEEIYRVEEYNSTADFLVGKTDKDGRVIEKKYWANVNFWFTRIKGTLIGFKPYAITKTRSYNDSDIIKMIESLVEVPKEQLSKDI